ncbi:hypothetical protein HDV00_010321 [Rhizophlyctis rosea]|nr:hypothetical protein HDV00_010321 [Rhizophlyctis rosea]
MPSPLREFKLEQPAYISVLNTPGVVSIPNLWVAPVVFKASAALNGFPWIWRTTDEQEQLINKARSLTTELSTLWKRYTAAPPPAPLPSPKPKREGESDEGEGGGEGSTQYKHRRRTKKESKASGGKGKGRGAKAGSVGSDAGSIGSSVGDETGGAATPVDSCVFVPNLQTSEYAALSIFGVALAGPDKR